MAQLWLPEKDEWIARPLSGGVFHVLGAVPTLPSGVVLRSAGSDKDWYLLAAPTAAVRVNGEPVPLGIRALRDKDEVRVAGAPPVFFSSEKLVGIEPYTGPAGATCLRCTKMIELNSPAVRCGCGRWYHENHATKRNCYSYGDGAICVECGAEAVASDQFRWSPEEL